MYLLRRGDTDDLRISKRERSLFRGLLGTDELVYDSQEPPLGSHLVTPAVAICITASTSAVARSFITRDSRRVCAEDRWKRFLLLVSHVASTSG